MGRSWRRPGSWYPACPENAGPVGAFQLGAHNVFGLFADAPLMHQINPRARFPISGARLPISCASENWGAW